MIHNVWLMCSCYKSLSAVRLDDNIVNLIRIMCELIWFVSSYNLISATGMIMIFVYGTLDVCLPELSDSVKEMSGEEHLKPASVVVITSRFSSAEPFISRRTQSPFDWL